MRRILIGLTLLVLVAVSAAIGMLVADWPQFSARIGSSAHHGHD